MEQGCYDLVSEQIVPEGFNLAMFNQKTKIPSVEGILTLEEKIHLLDLQISNLKTESQSSHESQNSFNELKLAILETNKLILENMVNTETQIGKPRVSSWNLANKMEKQQEQCLISAVDSNKKINELNILSHFSISVSVSLCLYFSSSLPLFPSSFFCSSSPSSVSAVLL